MAATLTATGTWTVPAISPKYVGGSGVTFVGVGTAGTFDSRTSSQKGTNLFDELNQFITLMSAAQGVPAVCVIDQLMLMLGDLRRQPALGERVYAP